MRSLGNSDVTVVILTKNSALRIKSCLNSVIRERPSEIIVVHRLSSDDTLSILKRYNVRIIIDSVSWGLGYSRQIGVEAAKGLYVMFVDSDVVLAPGCISTMRRELEDYGWVGIHAKILSAENLSYWQRAQQEESSRYYARVRPMDQIYTSAALFKRAVLLQYPFDVNQRESSEDIDLSRRLVENKQKLGVSSAVAYHYHRREFSAFAKQQFRSGLGNARLAFKYRKTRIFINPLLTVISRIVRNMFTKEITLVPYWFTGGLAQFLGVLVGLSRVRRSLVNSPTLPQTPALNSGLKTSRKPIERRASEKSQRNLA
jgi:glycosyltransferase involved in cell wall biosynthesis